MQENIYDNPEFFEAYSKLCRSVEGLNGAPEWPILKSMLPRVEGLRVLDLGCGYGWFSRWAREHGAKSVYAVDISERMLEKARAETEGPGITYAQGDLAELVLPPNAFDLVYSSLAFHYIEDLDGLLEEICKALDDEGALVFSVEHPIFTAPSNPGWVESAQGNVWPVDGYLDEGPRTTHWLTKDVVKHHRTVASYVNDLIRAGFHITQLEEWGPTDSQIEAFPDLADERHRPAFLLVAARCQPNSSDKADRIS